MAPITTDTPNNVMIYVIIWSNVQCFFRLFYPIDKDLLDGDQSKRALWLPGSEYAKGYASVVNIPGFSLCAKIIAGSRHIPAVWNAPLASSESPFPIIVFSHGLSSCRTTYCCICIDLASHGFIVAAAEHSGSKGMYTPRSSVILLRLNVKQRADECIATLDTLTAMHDGKEVENIMPDKFDFTQLQGKLDLDRVAICGHSFGGGTSIVAMAKDSRFKCSVPLDAWLFPLSGDVYEKVQQPILFINTYYFQWKENISKMNKLMPSEYNDARRMLTIRSVVKLKTIYKVK
ncbi:Platelet-activating factor acetylhydrolase [Apostichopus japonicus]|uniref:1-alkyl-2-acetylglycerophosphocholine esterase n=1 Tax=Stichopus japonicus TaxID=307972 RepID=A0A2G8JZU1_STIJA|nr:Platelet-activating factor acetylhydrolase [Apostichopus japonicus]